MEINANTMYEATFEQLIMIQKAMIEYKALYLETKAELDRLKEEKSQ